MSKAPQVRKESTTFRLDPEFKYTAEVGARILRKNLTNYIEWAIEESFKNVKFEDGLSLSDQMNNLWDIDEADRFVKLAYTYPTLLNYDEQRLLKIINENFIVFKKHNDNFVASNPEQEAAFKANLPMLEFIDFKKVRDHWEHLNNFVFGKEEELNIYE